MSITTHDLYRAAFYLHFKVDVHINGTYPHCYFIFNAPLWLRIYEKIGIVRYYSFARSRQILKSKCKEHIGSNGFNFMEAAHT